MGLPSIASVSMTGVDTPSRLERVSPRIIQFAKATTRLERLLQDKASLYLMIHQPIAESVTNAIPSIC